MENQKQGGLVASMKWDNKRYNLAIITLLLIMATCAITWLGYQSAARAVFSSRHIERDLFPMIESLGHLRGDVARMNGAASELALLSTQGLGPNDAAYKAELVEFYEAKARAKKGLPKSGNKKVWRSEAEHFDEISNFLEMMFEVSGRFVQAADRHASSNDLLLIKEELKQAERKLFKEIDALQGRVEKRSRYRFKRNSTLVTEAQTFLFGIGGAFSLILLVYGIFVWRLLVQEQAQNTALQISNHEKAVALLEAEAARNQAVRLNQAKSDFLAMMSHEIRTPMNGVMGMLSLLGETPLNDEQKKLARVAYESAKSLLSVINDILDLTRLQAGRFAIKLEVCDLRYILHGIMDMMDSTIRQKELDSHINIAQDIPNRLMLDPVRVRQVLINVVGNAVKFTLKGSIRLEASIGHIYADSLPYIKIEVIDSGPGIDDADLLAIFDPFTQTDSSLSRRHEGSGLGLAICKSLLEAMGGRITVTSQLGVGSIFIIWLPLEQAPVGSVAKNYDPSKKYRAATELPILVVDDNKVNRMLAEALVQRLGFSSQAAESGATAIELAKQTQFGAVLMDIQMPGMDGFEAMAGIRGLSEDHQKWPIIAMTAHAMAGFEDECLEKGMNGYVSKPINREKFEEILAQLGLTKEADVKTGPLLS